MLRVARIATDKLSENIHERMEDYRGRCEGQIDLDRWNQWYKDEPIHLVPVFYAGLMWCMQHSFTSLEFFVRIRQGDDGNLDHIFTFVNATE